MPTTADVPSPRGGRWRRHPGLRAVAIVLALALLPVSWSYGHALTAPGSQGWQVRTVEWFRDHGLNGVVDKVETAWLQSHSPKHGGVPTLLPHVGALLRTGAAPTRVPPPAGLRALPGEGVWRSAAPSVNGRVPVSTSFTRSDSVHTSFVTGLARLDTHVVRLQLVAGTKEPGGAGWAWGAQVPDDQRRHLLAAFNSGFKMKDARGGFFEDGRVGRPLVPGAASLVIRIDGTATVGEWGRDTTSTKGVAAVRQNLALIVDHGRTVTGLDRNPGHRWGNVKQNLYTWRSAIGVDRTGALIYAGGSGLDLKGIAEVMHRAGAVRAMELDIHTHMVTFNLFHHHVRSPVTGQKLIPTMTEPATRYLSVDQRDFVAVLSR